jgi:hypothetical protein
VGVEVVVQKVLVPTIVGFGGSRWKRSCYTKYGNCNIQEQQLVHQQLQHQEVIQFYNLQEGNLHSIIMASFAKIGLNNKVIEVLSVHNNVLKDANGIEQEIIGIDFLTKLNRLGYLETDFL